MPYLRILCPIKKKSFATSVETSVQHKASLPNLIKFVLPLLLYASRVDTRWAFFDILNIWLPNTRLK